MLAALVNTVTGVVFVGMGVMARVLYTVSRDVDRLAQRVATLEGKDTGNARK